MYLTSLIRLLGVEYSQSYRVNKYIVTSHFGNKHQKSYSLLSVIALELMMWSDLFIHAYKNIHLKVGSKTSDSIQGDISYKYTH